MAAFPHLLSSLHQPPFYCFLSLTAYAAAAADPGPVALLASACCRVASLEERQKQLVELCERQVADARAARDEEVARARQEAAAVQGDAARDKADVIAGW